MSPPLSRVGLAFCVAAASCVFEPSAPAPDDGTEADASSSSSGSSTGDVASSSTDPSSSSSSSSSSGGSNADSTTDASATICVLDDSVFDDGCVFDR